MINKFKDSLRTWEYHHVKLLERELATGSKNLRRVVRDKIKEMARTHNKTCVVCNSKIDEDDHRTVSMIFGPQDMKRKATFCAQDCLQYFLKKAHAIKR